MKKSLIIPKQIVTANALNEILKDTAVEIIDKKINRIVKTKDIDYKEYDGRIFNLQEYTLIPGFIQTHIHLCQTLFRGLADDLELLDWLQQKIFPFESAHNSGSLRLSAQLGINELVQSGTTTVLDMGTLNYQEVIFEELINSGMRAFAGKCMIDQNDLYEDFKASTEIELKTTYDLAKNYHNSADGRIKYGFAPRFVLSCSEHLLKETHEMMKDFEGSLYHTHSSENKSEIEAVRKLHNKENIEYFKSINVLDNKTVLAHCVHTSENEINILKETDTRIAHCPSSNLKLGSGIANIPRYLNEGISVSLGADGAPCNNNLNAFNEMKLAALIQKPFHGATSMDALTVFRMATIDGAKALHVDNETGSIEEGKKADIVLLDLSQPHNSLNVNSASVYSNIVYTCDKSNVKFVIIDGEFVLEEGKSLIYEEDELVKKGSSELKSLISRVGK